MLSQIFTGGDTELGGHQLYDHRHDIGPDHHPQQLIAIGCARLNVGGEVAWIDIADGGDKGRSQQRELDFSGSASGTLGGTALKHISLPV